MKRKAKLTDTQRRILLNAVAGRALDLGRAETTAAAAGWSQSIWSCKVNGWLTADGDLTTAGRAMVCEGEGE